MTETQAGEEFSFQSVFIVDDDPNNYRVLRILLQKEIGCNVEVARNKEDALLKLGEGYSPSLVLLDVCLPTPQDGFDVCRTIKEGELGSEIQVVMMTALVERYEVFRGCKEAGADDFLGRDDSIELKLVRIKNQLRLNAAKISLAASRRQLERAANIAEFVDAIHHDVLRALTVPQYIIGQVNDFLASLSNLAEGATSDLEAIRHQIQAFKDLADAGGEEKLISIEIAAKLREVTTLVDYQVMLACKRHICFTCPTNFDAKVNVYWPNLLYTLKELISNAATIYQQHCERNNLQKNGLIEVSANRISLDDSCYIRICVSDNGPGVPEEFREKIFEKGVTSRPDKGGTGRGLFFARERITRAGGKIYCIANDPVGACFVIELPEA